jgi:hypothetical protein
MTAKTGERNWRDRAAANRQIVLPRVQRRSIVCSFCAGAFKTRGTTRVLHKVVFQFCADCWTSRRNDCEDFATRVAGGPAR